MYQKQETAGSLVDQAVGEAVEKYLKVLNAEWLDKDCTLSHCSASSKAIPGVPDERSVFTKQERANLVGRDSERACFAPIIGFAIYSVAAQNQNPGRGAWACLLYTHDAADYKARVGDGRRRLIVSKLERTGYWHEHNTRDEL